jgi:hypothetical protein
MRLRRLPLLLLDAIISIAAGLILFILLTGGGIYSIGRIRISAYSYANALYCLIILIFLRSLLSREFGFLGIRKLNLNSILQKSSKFCSRLSQRLRTMDVKTAHRAVAGIIFVSLIIKIANAWHYYGFFTGDDVEIHEMTFAQLFNWDWQAWNLRNAFYPMTFIYPIQAILHYAGIEDPGMLIFSGRMVVALFSCLNLWMVFVITRFRFSNVALALLACAFLAISKLHTRYGSSELPRTVSSFFLLLAIWWTQKHDRILPTVMAAMSLGISCGIRFSEAVFLPPFLLLVRSKKGSSLSILFAILSVVSALFIIGVGDLVYWKKTFYSLLNMIDFTLLKGLSSRGYQPFYEYVATIPAWTNLAFVLLFAFALRSIPKDLLAFFWMPLVILSFLPHKEARYLLPVLPFFAICLAVALRNLLSRVEAENIISSRYPGRLYKPLFLVFLLVFGILFELDGFRFRRSEAAVDMAVFLNDRAKGSGVAIEQVWKAGGRLYMSRVKKIEDISPALVNDPQYVRKKIENPQIEFVALQKKDLQRYKYLNLIKQNGYREIQFTRRTDRNEYCLFRRVPMLSIESRGY